MNAPLAHPLDVASIALPADIAAPEAVYAERCKARALLHISGKLSLHDAVDGLQTYAEQSGLIDSIGQDEAQRIMGEFFAMVDLLPEVDDELSEACEAEIILRTADGVQRWRLADPRDRWRHTGELPPPAHVRNSDISPRAPDKPQYRTPQATRDAFWYVVSLADPERLKVWLADHPRDARFLIKLLESK